MPQPVFEDEQYIRARYDRVPASQGALITTVLLHHPPVNALSERVLDALARTLEHLETHEEVRAVVLTAREPGAFCAGADIRELLTTLKEPAQARALAAKAHSLLAGIEAMRKPVIAAIDGAALGGGCELAMACHYRIGNERTRMGQPEIGLFLPPGFGGTQRLPRLLEAAIADTQTSIPVALGWLLSGRVIRADIAKDAGLLDEVVGGASDVLSRARLLAAQCARGTQTPVTEAMGFRRQQRSQWDESEVLDWVELEQDPYLQQCLAQARYAGRGKVAEAIIEVVRTGLEEGIEAGLAAEVDAFTRFVMDPEHGGKKGIRLFLEKRSPPLPLRRRPQFGAEELKRMEDEYWLLPIGSPFVPGVTPLPQMQYAWAVAKDPATGEPDHGPPRDKEKEIVVEVERPGPNEVLLYVLASPIARTDVAAITGFPRCVFELHDEDEHITGSGGLGLVVELGEAVQAEGRLRLGDVVSVHPGRFELLDPQAGADPMRARFVHQGYDTPDGSHQQFMRAQGPQCLALPAGLPLEAAGSFLLGAGTAYRCLLSNFEIRSGKRMLVEDPARESGRWAVDLGVAFGVATTALVGNQEHVAAVRKRGASAVERTADRFTGGFTPVPAEPDRWAQWQAQGEAWLKAVRAQNDQALIDYAVSHGDENVFPRSFQALAEGGVIAVLDASTGGPLTFLGKPGNADPAAMLGRAGLHPGEAVVAYYGTDAEDDDPMGRQLLDTLRATRARVAVVTRTDGQRERLRSLGFEDALAGIVSIETIERREPAFRWPDSAPKPTAAGTQHEATHALTRHTVRPLARALARLLKSSGAADGVADLVVERAAQDTLAVSIRLLRPHTGRIVYSEDMAGRRYSFHATALSHGEGRILMPSARILGSHLCNPAEVEKARRLVENEVIEVAPVHLFDWHECPEAHQALWENSRDPLAGETGRGMLNHALPSKGLTSVDDLIVRWGSQKVQRGR